MSAQAMAAPRFAVPLDDVEAIGPFSSWANVKAQPYGAVGDGVADDTAAIQRALDELGRPGKPGTLYLPAGTYRITSSLRLTGNHATGYEAYWGGVGFIGADPATTRIVWDGPPGQAMLIQNGGYNTRYARITWDGKGVAEYGIAHWWDRLAGTYPDSASEDIDEVFQDMAVGILGGRGGANYGALNSEGLVRRVTFLRNWKAGLSTGSYNALDWWVWDSHFVDCARGVSNILTTLDGSNQAVEAGAGGVYVYRSLFERSTVADMHVAQTAYAWFSMHENVSIGSRRFYEANVMYNNGTEAILKHNRIIDTTDPTSIYNGNLGAPILIDNQIRTAVGNTGPVVKLDDPGPGDRDAVSVGNRFTVTNQIAKLAAADRVLRIDDLGVPRASIDASVPSMQPTAVNHNRQVFEVPAGANAAVIQATIDAAAASGAANPIVHLPPGNFALSTSLVVPAKAALQIAGDGASTIMWWQGANMQPMIQLQGPSYATLRDIQMIANNGAPAVSIEAADQENGRIFVQASTPGAIKASNLNQTQLTMQANSYLGQMTLSGAKSVVSIGAGGNGPTVELKDNSSVLLADTWYEGAQSNLYKLQSGNLTFLGGQLAPNVNVNPADPAIRLDGFSGNAAFVGVNMNLGNPGSAPVVAVSVSNETANTNALFLAMAASKPNFFQRTSSGGKVGLLIPRASQNGTLDTRLADQGSSSVLLGANSLTFTRDMLGQARSLVWDSTVITPPVNATNVHLHSVKANQTGGLLISGQ